MPASPKVGIVAVKQTYSLGLPVGIVHAEAGAIVAGIVPLLHATVGGAASGWLTPPSEEQVALSVLGAPELNQAFIVAVSAASSAGSGGCGIGACTSPIR